MNENLAIINNNIFDNDDFSFNNLTYSNGFDQLYNKKYYNHYYIKKHVKNSSINNIINSSHFEQPEIISTKQFDYPIDLTQDSFRIETIPIFNLKLPKSKDKKEHEKQKIFFKMKNVKNSLNNSKNKRSKKNISNSSIDEISISLKQLSVKGSKQKKKNQKNSRNKIFKKQPNTKNIMKNQNSQQLINNTTKTTFTLNNKSTIKKINFSKNKKIFNNLIIKNENQFSYINNNDNYNKILVLKEIINKQNNNIKLLKEQNNNLVEKIKRMHEENMNMLEAINSLKSEIYLSNDNKIESKNNGKTINSKKYKLNRYLSEPKYNSNLIDIKENIFTSKTIIYSLYDNNNILTYDFINNEFKLNPIINEDFQNTFNKEINTLYFFNELNNKLYIIAGINNDQLFIYNIKTNKLKKYSKLKNNHMYGSLIYISTKNKKEKGNLICLSGKYNKKVEIYNDENYIWNDKELEEMPEERCNSYYLILNNKYIYGFYGYNYILKKYLNNIVYYDLDNNKWNTILNNSLNNNLKGIKNHFCYENKNNNFIYILGGDTYDNKIIIDLEKNSIVKINQEIDNKRKEEFLFYQNFTYNIKDSYLALFDNKYNIHLIDFYSNEKKIIHYNN